MTTSKTNELFDSLGVLDIGLINPIIHSPIMNMFKTPHKNTDNKNNKNKNNKNNKDKDNINNYYRLGKFINKYNDNCVHGYINNHDSSEIRELDIFMKFGPLIDPIKYLNGSIKYQPELLINSKSSTEYLTAFVDNNKCAFVDGFFSYLSSKLLNEYGFINGVDFYGSFLAQKNNFTVNITDDIECLDEYSFFGKNENILYTLQNKQVSSDVMSSKAKPPITIENEPVELDLVELDLVELDVLNSHEHDNVVQNKEHELTEIELNDDELSNDVNSSRSLSLRSSNSSNSTDSDNEDIDTNNDKNNDNLNKSGKDCKDCKDCEDCEDCDCGDSWGTCSDSSYDSNLSDEIIASIKIFPVQVIAMENCKGTLDSLITHKLIGNEDEWGSIVIQILFCLITFKQAFEMTHNDLHSNNIMYIPTSEPFLYYMLKDVIYKVPTFGKIFKIIDFGRSIYSFKGKKLCSDCFSVDGDATTQYNFKPYFNENKPVINPNFSFDLCRLGCALYDVILDDNTEISKIILEWVLDDKGRNVLYKRDGSERYPDFKLYKMIARTVHNHIPMSVLNNKYFGKYIISKKSFKDTQSKLINIDAIPCLC